MAVRRAPHTATVETPAPPAEPTPRLFTVDEYYKMAEAGILHPEERVQLIEGRIIKMPPKSPLHAWSVDRLTGLMIMQFKENARTRNQSPIRLSTFSESEPDVALVKVHPDEPRIYASRHPVPDDTLLTIEVADATLSFDLNEKAAMYARYGIADLWVVDLLDDRLVVHRELTAEGYASVRTLARGESISLMAFPDVTFTVDEILG